MVLFRVSDDKITILMYCENYSYCKSACCALCCAV